MKTLVAYFSRTGQTAQIAKEIARRCGAHLDAIQPQPRTPLLPTAWRFHWETLVHAEPPIQRPGRNPGLYDLVVIGVPILRVGLAPPVRSYVRQYGDRFKQIAFFCAEGGGVDERGFAELGRLCGKQPIATFGVARKNLPMAATRKQMTDFVDSVRGEIVDR